MKPPLIEKLEARLGRSLTKAPDHVGDPLAGLMVVSRHEPAKYALDREGKLIGLNLAGAGLGDEQLQEILDHTEKKHLRALNLSGNKLSDLAFMGHLPNLEQLDFDENPINNPAPEIITQGFEAIHRHFLRLAEAENPDELDYLYEAKILIIGRTGAGKTSLRFKLRHPNEPMPDQSDSTRGIDVEPLVFDLADGRKFRMNVWDFEGQEISHQTHQFFLTKRSLYVFVADQRTEKSDFDYWLPIVELLGDSSPMMILQNERKAEGETSGQICGINLDGLRKSFGNFLCEGEHRVNLKEVAEGECHDPEQLKAFWDFHTELKQRLIELPIVGTKLLRTWVDIRTAIEKEAIKRPHMPVDDFWKMCRDNKIEDLQDQQDLSALFHDLGIFLHFQNPERPSLLSRMVILQNEWATKAVYQVLKTDWLRDENRGHFSLADLRRVWKGSDFVPYAEELLELMMRFEICYQVAESGVYVAPQLSPASPPEDYELPETESVLQLRYTYEFMPKGLITRLAVRMHPLIAKGQKWAWKDGFALEQDGAMAEVIEAYGVREIQIRVVGRQSRRLLNTIAYEVDRLNKGYHFSERFPAHKLLPCVCSVCREAAEPHFFKYQELVVQKEEGWTQVPCGKTGKPAQVDALFENILEGDDRARLENRAIIDKLDELNSGQKITHAKLDDQTDLLLDMAWLAEKDRYELKGFFSQLDRASTRQLEVLSDLMQALENSLREAVPQLPPGSDLASPAKQALTEIKTKSDLKAKFKLTIPLLPGFLAFEKEISADPFALFKKIWQDIAAGKVFTE